MQHLIITLLYFSCDSNFIKSQKAQEYEEYVLPNTNVVYSNFILQLSSVLAGKLLLLLAR
jgi:hypothetical protein